MLHAAPPFPDLHTFQSRLRGRLICKGDGDYDQVRRVWNGRIDKRPAAIVRCADVVDVVTAVEFACEHHLLVAVRSGGHSLSGSSVCNEGLVIDLSGMKGIRVDQEKRMAWARALWEALEPWANSGVYVNFLSDEGEGRVRASYGINYERLVALKNRYDPTNVFSLNQNIKPAPKETCEVPQHRFNRSA